MNSINKIFVTFGDGPDGIKDAVNRVSEQANKLKFFDKIISGNLEYLKNNCFKEYDFNNKFISQNAKGLGYWIWKPILLKHVLETSQENSIVLYADSGCEFSSVNLQSIQYFFELAQKKNTVFFKLPYHEAEWTKADLFDHKMININNPENLNQISATYFFIKNTLQNRNFINKWYFIACENNYHYLNDTPSFTKNHSDFVEHRHDQSILSCLVHSNKLYNCSSGYTFGPSLVYYVNSPFRKFFIHAFHNKTGKSLLENNQLKKTYAKSV